ncbi:MAG: AAA family ATPase [Rhizobium sp.]|nr:AAA family ATPase [Rhizobium sp.]
MGYVPLRPKMKPYMLAEVAKFGIRSVLRHHLKAENHAFVAVLVVPPTADPVIYHDAAFLLLKDDQPSGDLEFDRWRVEYYTGGKDSPSKSDLEHLAAADRTVVFLTERCELPRSLALATDVYAEIPEPTAEHFLVAALNCGIDEMTEADAEYLARLPFQDIKAAMGVGRPFRSAMRRLREVPADDGVAGVEETPPPRVDLSKMDEIVGHAEIKSWAAAMAEDIGLWREGVLQWREVDRGAVVTGPPGTGKTRLARAIAEACGMRFIPTSAAKWQAKGHLGDYLKAMHQVFADAAKKPPSLVFIDEIDAVGDRAQQSGDNEAYMRQAINGLLEVLDGSDGREGVVVLGATNDVFVVDPAVLRPGRLERVFHVGLPDALERRAILAFHLLPCAPPEDLDWFDDVSEGMSGADIEMVARDVKRLARRGRRDPTSELLRTSMPATRRIDGDELKRNAIHEAGHAVIGLELCVRTLVSVSISEFVLSGSSSRSVGQARFESPRGVPRGRQELLDEIAMLMGGIAAEEVLLGSFVDGAGGLEGSDLATATDLTTIVHCQLGMGFTLTSEVGQGPRDLRAMRQLNPVAWQQIDETVRGQFERARSIIVDLKSSVEIVATELLARKRLSGDDVRVMLAASRSPPNPQ